MSNKFLKYSLVIVASGAIAIVALYGVGLGNACSIKQIDITGDLKRYDQTKDPELCSQINDKISQFDNDCKGNIETLDCG
ncbi:MAG: hypothetical protein KGI25_07225 [Thaumarchaeota archaeon]|nr:hypothetical protein [Nitrososphaerota archaeon]